MWMQHYDIFSGSYFCLLCGEYLSELCRVVFKLIELRLIIMEVRSNGLDQLQIPLMEVVWHQVTTA